jgi:non-specific serine/threonine protein kinase/serine/threonine-protein kinase
MNHPNIARVFDAGATEQGRPFFAMELVHGEPITSYCDRNRLSIRERLELFLQVCDGAQHAHQKGIIHRDLKPSNVLVTAQDGRPVPKIIDFGIAKAVTQQLTDMTMVTSLGTMIGTPEYMSPEQAEMTGLDIDTRSDVFSLGVLLYELLVGALPFDSETLREGGIVRMQRRIREDEPPRPSTRVTAFGLTAEPRAEMRRHSNRTLARQLRGDLDWIVLKALEKDRTRRYATANALALDIRRHLDDEPVRASPPSTVYRARKFVRRHRGAVVAASLFLAALIAGIVGTTTGLVRAVRAERQAQEEAETARQVSDFLVGLFRVADPENAQGDTITARQILADGAKRIESELADRPVTQARMMHTIGTVYRQLGLYDEARNLLQRALELQSQQLGDRSLEVAQSRLDLSALLRRTGDYERAEALARQALEILEAEHGPQHPQVADALAVLGWALTRVEENDEALSAFERALAVRIAALGERHLDTAHSRSDLGIFLWRQGQFERAESLLNEALAVFEESLGPDDYQVRSTLNNLAVLYWTSARYAEAQALYERALTIKERVLGRDHAEVATTLNNLALLYDAQEQPAEALPLLHRAYSIFESTLGHDHDKTAMTLGNLAWINYRLGEHDRAASYYDQALSAYELSVGPDHTNVAIVLRDASRLHADIGEWRKAEAFVGRARRIFAETLGADHPEVAACLHTLADFNMRQGRPREAEPLYRQALAIRQKRLGPEHPSAVATLEALEALTGRAEPSGAGQDG